MEFNKIFAGFLIAGIIIMSAGFIANGIMGNGEHGGEHAKNAYHIDVAVAASHGETTKKAPVGPEPITDLLASADIEKGKKRSKACASCHSFDKGGKTKTGPNLWNIVGRKVASVDGFAYSSAMKDHGGVWSYDRLNEFLTKPRKVVSGTKMTYVGMKKTKDRAALVAWLRTLSDSPVDLP